MAKAKGKIEKLVIKPATYTEPNVVTTASDRKIKEGGKAMWLKKNMERPGQYRIPFQADRTQFVECNDGLYAILIDGERIETRFTVGKMKLAEEYFK